MPKFVPAAAAALLALSLIGNGAMAQTQAPAQSAPSTSAAPSDQPSTEDILTAAIGCLATYDLVLAKGTTATDKTKGARQAAYDLYKQYSGKTDADVQSDVQKADEIFPGMVAEGTTKLEEFQATCDNAFMNMPAASAAPAK